MNVLHVVLVEDDKDIAFLLTNLLDQEEWIEAVHVATPEAAMDTDLWTFNSGASVVGVIDLMLPGISGVRVAGWVHDHMPGIPLIALTGASYHSPIAMEAKQSGYFRTILYKPVGNSDMIDCIVKAGELNER